MWPSSEQITAEVKLAFKLKKLLLTMVVQIG